MKTVTLTYVDPQEAHRSDGAGLLTAITASGDAVIGLWHPTRKFVDINKTSDPTSESERYLADSIDDAMTWMLGVALAREPVE